MAGLLSRRVHTDDITWNMLVVVSKMAAGIHRETAMVASARLCSVRLSVS